MLCSRRTPSMTMTVARRRPGGCSRFWRVILAGQRTRAACAQASATARRGMLPTRRRGRCGAAGLRRPGCGPRRATGPGPSTPRRSAVRAGCARPCRTAGQRRGSRCRRGIGIGDCAEVKSAVGIPTSDTFRLKFTFAAGPTSRRRHRHRTPSRPGSR